MVIHGYLSGLSRPGQVAHSFHDVVGAPVIDKLVLSRRTHEYQDWVEAFARNHGIPIEWANPTVSFAAEDAKLYPCLCEVLRKRDFPLLAQYATADAARIFDCDVRVIQERIHSGKWPARDLPKRGRFLSCDLEGFLQLPLPASAKTEEPTGVRK